MSPRSALILKPIAGKSGFERMRLDIALDFSFVFLIEYSIRNITHRMKDEKFIRFLFVFTLTVHKLAIDEPGARAKSKEKSECETDLRCLNPTEDLQDDCGTASHL